VAKYRIISTRKGPLQIYQAHNAITESQKRFLNPPPPSPRPDLPITAAPFTETRSRARTCGELGADTGGSEKEHGGRSRYGSGSHLHPSKRAGAHRYSPSLGSLRRGGGVGLGAAAGDGVVRSVPRWSLRPCRSGLAFVLIDPESRRLGWTR
jgi:hypothetical protein